MKLVYVPCGMDDLRGPFVVETAEGWVEEVRRARVELVGDRFCLVGQLLGPAGPGRFRVRFKDGTEVTVRPAAEWRHVPDGSDPYAAGDPGASVA